MQREDVFFNRLEQSIHVVDLVGLERLAFDTFVGRIMSEHFFKGRGELVL